MRLLWVCLVVALVHPTVSMAHTHDSEAFVGLSLFHGSSFLRGLVLSYELTGEKRDEKNRGSWVVDVAAYERESRNDYTVFGARRLSWGTMGPRRRYAVSIQALGGGQSISGVGRSLFGGFGAGLEMVCHRRPRSDVTYVQSPPRRPAETLGQRTPIRYDETGFRLQLDVLGTRTDGAWKARPRITFGVVVRVAEELH